MSKRICSLYLLAGMLLLGIVVDCSADSAGEFQFVEEFRQARQYFNNGDYQRAELGFKDVQAEYPGSKDAFHSQFYLIRVYGETGNAPALQAAVDNFLAGYSNFELYPQKLYDTGYELKKMKEYEQAQRLYEKVVTDYPQYEYTARAAHFLALLRIQDSREEIISLIKAGDFAAADSAIDDLVIEFGDNKALGGALNILGQRYEDQEQYQRARNVYQRIVDLLPGSKDADWVGLDIRRMDITLIIDSGEDSEVLSEVDKLISDYNDHPRLSRAVYMTAEVYQKNALKTEEQAEDNLTKALQIFEKVMNELPGSAFGANACLCVGDCYRRLGDYAKSIECCETLIINYPDHELVCDALYMTGRNYENMKEDGIVTESVADEKIRAAYEELLSKCPTHTSAEHARKWLGL